jgi:hypothetical protein
MWVVASLPPAGSFWYAVSVFWDLGIQLVRGFFRLFTYPTESGSPRPDITKKGRP